MDAAVIDRIAARVAEAVTSGEAVAPLALRLLVRRFLVSGEQFRTPLAAALEADATTEGAADPDRLLLLAEAMQVSDDARIRESVVRQAAEIASRWPSRGAVADAARAIDSCLAAGTALSADTLLVGVIDELERVVALAYEPGDGVSQMLSTRTRTTGDLATHASVATVLLHAYDLTGRTAYPMLAEELARASLTGPQPPMTLASCEAAQVLTRLATLQRDADYRTMAVTRDDGRYHELAERWLGEVDDEAALPLPLAAAYALALDEWLTLT